MTTSNPCIVLACDGSEQSLHAAEMAADLAQATGQPLKLLSVFPGSRAEKLVISGAMPDELEKKQKEYAREVFDAARAVVSKKVEPAEVVLLRGDPAHEIIEYMEANPGAHLVLGRRGYSLVRRLTLGSVSEKVLRHATGPVTVVSG